MAISIPVALAAAVAASAVPPAPAALVAKPKWVVNYANSSCILSRDRSPTEPGVAIRTRPFAEEYEFVVLMAPAADRPFNGQGSVMVGDLPAGPDRWVAMGSARQGAARLVETTIKVTEIAAASASARMRILVPDKLDVIVKLPNIAKAAAALKTCEDDLAKRWKITRSWVIDPKPIPDTRGPFRHSDYPDQLIMNNRSGAILALLGIDEAGRVSDCRIIERSGDIMFEQVVCTVFRKRARYVPALDSRGQPTASYHLAPTVRFVLAH